MPFDPAPASAAAETSVATEPRLQFDRYSLRFLDLRVEADYAAYREERVGKWLPKLTVVVACVVLFGVVLDLLIFDQDQPAWRIIALRCAIAGLMLGAAAWLFWAGRPRHLQVWIMGAVTALHISWLIATPAMRGHFDEYLGVLPVNMLMTFIVSGLMFQYARWIGLGAAIAYGTVIVLFYSKQPYGPIFYLMVLSFYAAYAAYVAERARREAWSLLQNVLPACIANRMQSGERLIADHHEEAGVLFADIVGFTALAERKSPAEVVALLSEIFSRFDQITDALDLEKIKTIGDCYMAVGGLPITRPRDPHRIALAALRMQEAVREIAARDGIALQIRAGVHLGPVVAGVIGERKFVYDLWGDTVNVASRLESGAEKGAVLISADLRHELESRADHGFDFGPIEEIEMKNRTGGFAACTLRGHTSLATP
ncbi:MAG: adenylate/guanylate cyclase domain-containing protein [Pseudomonadota bacterium]